ncbi:putative disease resistance RPP13-like protein 1 [Arachis ipaensis]|uniref:putative disease resistance RPP13-like protein 1 n=1 Tax=Arachis ipaensis TaxID=130454 RepID=UPI000A2AF495|nr:putative disease resistance RPP13-like protein 1 [Arachis ipaensis]
MAGAIVSHALVSSFIQVVFDKLASPEFVNFIRGKKLHKKLIKRLETNLYAVQAVLNDAEQRQINDPAVKKWLDDVKDAVYDVDDLLDRVSTEAGTAQKKAARWYNLCSRPLQTPYQHISRWAEVSYIPEIQIIYQGLSNSS